MIIRRLAVLAAALLVLPAAAPAQDARVVRREAGALVYENVPEGTPRIREAIRRYQNTRSAQFQDWLSDGSMLITTRFGSTSQLHRVAAPGAAREQLTFFDEPVGGALAVPRENAGSIAATSAGRSTSRATWPTGRAGKSRSPNRARATWASCSRTTDAGSPGARPTRAIPTTT